jgi:hypothetical protein
MPWRLQSFSRREDTGTFFAAAWKACGGLHLVPTFPYGQPGAPGPSSAAAEGPGIRSSQTEHRPGPPSSEAEGTLGFHNGGNPPANRKTANHSTVSENAKNPHLFNALRPFPTKSEPLAQKHCSISCNPLLKSTDLLATNTLNAQPCEVNPYKKCNHLSEHFALFRTT